MCYGSGCMFEGHMGDCTVHTLNFKKKYGYTSCVVGRSVQDEDDEEFYESHKEELDKIYRQYREDQDKEFEKFVEEFSK
jgi:hypothetical protein